MLLNAALATQSDLAAEAPDAYRMLLADKRSPATRRAYQSDLVAFFGGPPSAADVAAFLSLPVHALALRLAGHKADLIARGLSEATVNRRLAAVRALMGVGYRLGVCATDGRGLVTGERARSYRDTRGVAVGVLRHLLAAPDTETTRGLRDAAILRLLVENGLRRAELCALNVEHFSRGDTRLFIRGKGRGTQAEPVTLSNRVTEAIGAYLDAAGHGEAPCSPLFLNADHRPSHSGQRLTVDGLFYLVKTYGAAVGVTGLTPHKLRHSAITCALEATSGDVRRVQRFSRHTDIRTLVIYDDARRDMQGEVSNLISAMV